MTKYCLKLYVIGDSPLAKKAIANLTEIAKKKSIKKYYRIKIIDLLLHPELSEKEEIVATPLLIKELPKPMRRIIGDLSNHENVLIGLDLNEDC